MAGSYERDVDVLERELQSIEETFRSLSESDWTDRTLLQPIDPDQRHWSLLELAAHFDISIGLTRMLIADQSPDGQPGRDRISFFIFARSEVAPVIYDYAVMTAEGQTPESMLAKLHETFTKTIEESRAMPPETVGSGYYALMRLDEFVSSRIVEAVVHGIDLTDPLGRPCQASPEAIATTAAILDELLARRTVGGRPADLGDDVAWIRAASGREKHGDPRLPLIG
jgi:mycothiol maleylpyruvate isomerase-like protein